MPQVVTEGEGGAIEFNQLVTIRYTGRVQGTGVEFATDEEIATYIGACWHRPGASC
jgi:hypothetical protein